MDPKDARLNILGNYSPVSLRGEDLIFYEIYVKKQSLFNFGFG
jgi:hypothetical protein